MGALVNGRERLHRESSPLIDLRALGAPNVRDGNGVRLGGALAEPKRFAVLLHLVLAKPLGFQRREELIARFWPALAPEQARAELRRCVNGLRDALGPGVLATRRGEEEIRVVPGAVACDALRFEQALDAGRPTDALRMYRGDLAPGLTLHAAPAADEWLAGERARLRALAVGAARMLSAEHEAAHHVTQAVACSRRAAELAPEDESIWRELIALLGRVGDRPGALNAFGRLLRQVPGEPSAETVSVVDAIRAHAEHPVERGREPTPPFGTLRTISARGSVPIADQAPPRVVAGYRIERELVRRESVTEYLARDERTGGHVIVKVLRPFVARALAARRFEAAMRPAVALTHPNIVPVLVAGSDGGIVYCVVPEVAGESLRALLRSAGRLPVDDAVRITERIADALDHAHRHGIVHRNVAPESILIARNDVALADVGLAAAVRASMLDDTVAVSDGDGGRIALALATPGYMSPEQARGDEPLDGRTDIYSLACVTYEMLAGASPFRAGTRQGTLSRQIVGAVPPIGPRRDDVPDGIDAVLRRAFARDASVRYAAAGDFAADLREAAERPMGLLSRVRRFAAGLARPPIDERFPR